MAVVGLDGKELISDKPTSPSEPTPNKYEVFNEHGESLGVFSGFLGLSGSWLAIGDGEGVVIFAAAEGKWSKIIKLPDEVTVN